MKLKQSVCFPIMEPLPVSLNELMKRAAQIGFEAVEIWNPDSQFGALADMARENGLKVASFCGNNGIQHGLILGESVRRPCYCIGEGHVLPTLDPKATRDQRAPFLQPPLKSRS